MKKMCLVEHVRRHNVVAKTQNYIDLDGPSSITGKFVEQFNIALPC